MKKRWAKNALRRKKNQTAPLDSIARALFSERTQVEFEPLWRALRNGIGSRRLGIDPRTFETEEAICKTDGFFPLAARLWIECLLSLFLIYYLYLFLNPFRYSSLSHVTVRGFKRWRQWRSASPSMSQRRRPFTLPLRLWLSSIAPSLQGHA